jgi:Tfp pilus assembly protein PilZ
MMQPCRRRSERVLTDWEGWIYVPHGVARATVMNIGAHGLFARTTYRFTVGQELRVVVAMPDGLIDLRVVVRFCGETVAGQGVGLELREMPATRTARWLRNYANELALAAAPLRRAA